ncbi:MAG: hypothetical protein CL912_00590 [Deltaproteobacteria bacterium]|nr:hypothetical protein [Deltaproteobacteria bacterium]
MHLQCSSGVFASALEQALALPFPRASKIPTGNYRLPYSPPHQTYHLTICDRFLIWIGSDQERTFGPTISRLIHDNIEPERMILWDSKKRGGRPDSVQLLKDTWHNFGAEVIFITSNMKGNDEMMQGCHAGTFDTILLSPLKSSLTTCSWLTCFWHTLGLLKPRQVTGRKAQILVLEYDRGGFL